MPHVTDRNEAASAHSAQMVAQRRSRNIGCFGEEELGAETGSITTGPTIAPGLFVSCGALQTADMSALAWTTFVVGFGQKYSEC
jgi:hypothetical protein